MSIRGESGGLRWRIGARADRHPYFALTACLRFSVKTKRRQGIPLPAYLAGGHDAPPSKPPAADCDDLGNKNQDYSQTEVGWWAAY
jgi:hypothetical protein